MVRDLKSYMPLYIIAHMKKPGAVIDTNIIISALRSKQGASNKLLSLIGSGAFEIHVSIPLVLEYEEVLTRQRKQLRLRHEDIADLIDSICTLAIRHNKVHFSWRPFLPDIADEFILDLAIAGRRHYIVTYNNKDFIGVEKFGIQVIEPIDLLRIIGVLG